MKYIKYFKGDESMQYTILAGQGKDINESLENLEHEVRRCCNSGWRPQGGVSVTVTKYEWYSACQAMVKEE